MKKMRVNLLVICLFFIGTALQGVSADSNEQKYHAVKAEQGESFWNRWFGRGEKRDNEVNDIKEKQNVKKETLYRRSSNNLFNDSERTAVQNYYRQSVTEQHHQKGKKKQLPPGLQKKLNRGGEMPPGWTSKIARGDVLDVDTLRYSERLPDDLYRRLPASRDGEAVRRVGDKVVRVVEGNGTVIDVIDLADIILR